MVILTHEGPGFRSKLMAKRDALARAKQLGEDPQFTGVRTLEHARSRKPERFFVVCQPVDEQTRSTLLEQLQQDRITRAEEEGPYLLWAQAEPPTWYCLSLSDELYSLTPEERHCTCRDAGVCRDNDLVCKHVIAFERGLGVFYSPEQWQRLRLLVEKIGQPQAERQPVALPVAA
jgi:hypothetical protein